MGQNELERMYDWSAKIETARTSGLTTKQWCKENGVTIRQFYYWRKKIRDERSSETAVKAASSCTSRVGAFCEIKIPGSEKETDAFPSDLKTENLILLETGKFRLYIPSSFSREALRSILAVIGNA